MTWDQKRRMPSDYIDPHKAARILAAHGLVCHLCGHEGGVLNVDHDLALGTPTHGHPTCKTPPSRHPHQVVDHDAESRRSATQRITPPSPTTLGGLPPPG
jgi:hypothetical protein